MICVVNQMNVIVSINFFLLFSIQLQGDSLPWSFRTDCQHVWMLCQSTDCPLLRNVLPQEIPIHGWLV